MPDGPGRWRPRGDLKGLPAGAQHVAAEASVRRPPSFNLPGPEARAPPVTHGGPQAEIAPQGGIYGACAGMVDCSVLAPMFRLRWHHDQKRAFKFHGQLQL